MSSVSSSSSSSANMMRITGMSTGMDTDAMVKAMTANYQIKIDKANQDQQVVQWKQEMYRDIIKDVKGLQDYFDPLSSKYILGESKFNPTKVTNTSESTVGFTATSTAQEGNYKINVTQLAKPAVLQGTAITGSVGLSTNLKTSGLASSGDTLEFTIGTADPITITVDDNTTIKSVLDKFNENTSDVTANFDELSKKFVFTKNDSGVDTGLNIAIGGTAAVKTKLGLDSLSTSAVQGSATTATSSATLVGTGGVGVTNGSKLTFTINGKSVQTAQIDGTTTIQNVLDTINNNTDIKALGVTASFDETSKKFVFATNGSGTASNISVSVASDAGAGAAADIGKLGLSSLSASGQNAAFTLTYPDGRSETITNQTSNEFTANGITYNLKSIGSADVTVAKNDVDSVVNNIKSFITDYNNIVEKIQGKLTEKKQFTYKPLTDEQKEDMEATDITAWETKAKQGILKNDDYLENLLGDLRGTFSDLVYSDKTTSTKNPFSIGSYGSGSLGLDTSTEVSESGKIFIKDESKLKEAISSNIENLTEFLIGKSSKSLNSEDEYIGSDTYYEDGLFTRMDKIIRTYAGDPAIGKDGTSTVKGLLNIFANKQYDYSITGSTSKNTMPDKIYQKSLSIEKLQTQMKNAETRYYAKFAKLETAMNEMNAQMSSFSAQMGISQ